MCGIAGLYFDAQAARVAEARSVVGAMLGALSHRGPDGEGIAATGPVCLGHRRLSILDIEGGHQPLRSPSGRVSLVFNGEIYNYLDLRGRLEAKGHVFRTRSDSEVLAAALDEWSVDALPELRGMFAFAAWDSGRGELLLARDRLGKKPLYFARRGGAVGFASELPSLLCWGAIERRPDAAALAGFLRHGYVAAPRTAVEGVRKLEAGTYLRLPHGAAFGEREPRSYWSIRYAPKTPGARGLVDELGELIDAAVSDRLIADVPVGAFLSSGLDSSLIAASASRLGRESLRTFTVGFDDDARLDERPAARDLARLIGATHTERRVALDAVAQLPDLVRWMGEPLGDPSALPTFAVASAARGSVKVVLTGDGGDETFAGYGRYARSRLSLAYASMPAPLRRAARAVLRRLGEAGARLEAAESRVGQGPGRAYADLMSVFGVEDAARLVHPDHRGAARAALAEEPLARLHDEAPSSEWLDRLLFTDLKSYLADGVLVKVDRMTMANSIEARSPLLDHRLVEFAARLPSAQKRRPGADGKRLLREVARRRLPRWVIDRPKLGFNIPMRAWMTAGPLREAVDRALDESRMVADGWLDRAEVTRECAEGRTGEASIGNRLWSLYVLELWYDRVLMAPAGGSGEREVRRP